MAINVISEAKRCLNCKKPMCREGCPINTPIPTMIHTFLEGDINEAGRMLFDNNPLSMICSMICNHEKQCQGHCVLNRKGAPVHISSIENYISDNYFDKLKFPDIEKNGMRVGIIGSGPAGITIAMVLARRGYDITIFEGKEKIGGVLQYGIPEFRLPKTILARYKRKMWEMGIKIRPNTSIGTTISVDDMFRDGYSAIFIGTGVWRPNTLHIKGE
ncbi:MAG: NAD(P)-binding protein, partial [Clostridia bacterium]|nr:NAD(P)-binding protein [Clostridia bacterium]